MKKKILAICIGFVLAVTAITSVTLAYLTDTKTQVNTFTSGNVNITLDEAKVVLDNEGYIASYDGRTDQKQSYGIVFPGQTITKDPTITNVGSEKAYVAAKVVISADDLDTLIGINDSNLLGYDDILQGGLLNADNEDKCTIIPVKESKDDLAIYIFVNDPLAKDEDVVLFNTLKIYSGWDNDDISKGMTITVTAYASQTQTFDSCYTAMTTAFGNVFEFNN